VRVGPHDGVAVAVTGRRETVSGDHPRRSRVQSGDGDSVAVGIDADDMVNEFCQHDDGTSK
jgi:hypothetical protein